MGKKTKSKQRLDTYYHFAKQQGYRSRAAYKLIQLNRKYNFLNNSTVLIDLCAAPGGWMQVASQSMPLNSTIVGVDLDPIKKVPGTKSFQGDITTQSCYEQLRKQIKNQKCDVVLNDGAPNVGANWSKDAYTQSELVLAAMKLACNFLREGGYFVTKVFRSTDFQSLMWVFKKFFERVEATKPKASRFSSAQIFVVCAGYLAPSFIDEKLFDAKHVFQDTEADHFHEQLAGQITSIDKLLQDRRKRGGYEDNAPMHLYKEIPLTSFMQAENPLLIFATYNRITLSKQQKEKYFGLIKNMPSDMQQLLKDLKVIGKREISGILRWRGKVRHHFNQQKLKAKNAQKSDVQVMDQQQNSEEQLERQLLKSKKRQIKNIKQKEEKRGQLMIRSELAGKQQEQQDVDFGNNQQQAFPSDMQQIEYYVDDQIKQQQKKDKKKFGSLSAKEMQNQLQEMYETKQRIKQEKQQKIRSAKQDRKDLKEQRMQNKKSKLKSRKIGADPALVGKVEREDDDMEEQQNQIINDGQIKFRNPLAQMQDEDLYISQNQEDYDDNQEIDPNEKIQGELSDDEAYVIPKPKSDMQKRRQTLKKQKQKKQKKLKKNIEEGQQAGQIQIVKQGKQNIRSMDDYNIDQLAQTLAIGKKMLRNRSRDQIIDNSYGRYSFEDHDQLPKWFVQDEKKHCFKKPPITKEQFQQQKQRLQAINARLPKKILQAKVRRKMRIQKKLKKTQKLAENVMNQDGVTQFNKLKQVSKMYDKSKRELKDVKKYVVSSKSKTGSGKDSRNVKHVDKRLKKDKRSQKIKKTRHVHRKNKKRGKF